MLLMALAAQPALDPDMWWHLRIGQRILAGGDAVYVDDFSHSRAGTLHQNHSPLAQLLMAVLWNGAGYSALTLLVALLAVAGLAFVYRAGAGSIYMQGFLLVLTGTCAAAYWSPRPQMFTFLGSALLLYLMRRIKRRQTTHLWLLPPLMLLWGCLHGGYAVGFLLLLGFLLGEWLNRRTGWGQELPTRHSLQHLAVASALALLLMPLHPLGLEIYALPFDTVTMPELHEFIREWQPPDFSQPLTWPMLLLCAALLITQWHSRRRIDASEWLLALGTFLLALTATRNISLFALAAYPPLSANLHDILQRQGLVIPQRTWESPRRVAANCALLLVVALGCVARIAYVSSAQTIEQLLQQQYPVAALEHMPQAHNGALFNSYNWGGYLIYTVPQHPVFIDGRSDLYGELLAEYARAVKDPSGWQALFTAHDIGIALVEADGLLAAQLADASGWITLHRDGLAALFLHGN